MTPVKQQVANIGQFWGLRTDCPSSKCPPQWSPDCSDLVFTKDGVSTRPPFRALLTLPAEVVWRKEFACKNGSVQILALDINGVLYSIAQDGTFSQIGSVAPGSSCCSVTAYGREYMAFFIGGEPSDAPLQWDGTYLTRVSQGGPGAAPVVTNYTIPPSNLIAGSASTAINVTSAQPVDQVTVQITSGEDQEPTYGPGGGGGYQPPQYETYYTSLLYTTSAAHGLVAGESVIIAGNTLYNFAAASVTEVPSTTTFKVAYQTMDPTPGTGGTVTPTAPLLIRLNNQVTAATSSPHNLRRGYQVAIAGVPDQNIGGGVSSIVIDNTANPGLAHITTTAPHGLAPNEYVTLSNVTNVQVGGGIASGFVVEGITTLTMNTPHNLQVGANIIVVAATGGGGLGPPLPWVVSSVASPTVFSYGFPNTNNTTVSSGTVTLVWPGNQGDNESFVVQSVDSPNSFFVQLSYSNGTWTSGTLTFAWNGTFYVTSVPSATTFTYKQTGPDLVLETGTGTVTPKGQLAAGDHLICQHFINRNGSITAPSPYARFTASGGTYISVQQMAIGPPNVVGRIISLTGASGSKFFLMTIPAQVAGLQVSTSTLVQDNVTTSAIFDVADVTLLSQQGIDIPGNNLFEQIVLNTPKGVAWYADRLFWIGEKNVVENFLNLGFDGGTLSGSTLPLGWTATGNPVVTQVGVIPALVVTGPDAGTISQSASTDFQGTAIIQPNLAYALRFWIKGSSSKVGAFTATLSSASTGFTSAASYNLSALTADGYVTADFSARMPASTPSDLLLTLSISGLASGATVTYRDVQIVYADNPNRSILARASYVQNPEAYDYETGNIGPNNDSTEIRAMFVLQESLHFLTAQKLYYTQNIGNSEPSSWDPVEVSDKCGAFNSNSAVAGKGWGAWGGPNGSFWYTGGIPTKTTKEIIPTWRKVQTITNIYDDPDFERVYFGVVINGVKSQLVYDYHEYGIDGVYKWCPWQRPVDWTCSSAAGTVFVIGSTFYGLDTSPGVSDDNLGAIGGYITFAPIGVSMADKQYDYMGLRIYGTGVMTPFLYNTTLTQIPRTLKIQSLETLLDTIAEWPTLNITGRLLYLKLGQPGVQFSLEDATFVYQNNPNGAYSGVR